MSTLQTRIQNLERQQGPLADLPTFLDEQERLRYWADVDAQLSYDRGRNWPENRYGMTLEDSARFLAKRRMILKRARAWVESKKQKEQEQ